MRLYIQNFCNVQHMLDVGITDTVESLQSTVDMLFSSATSALYRMIHCGKLLKRGKTLADYNMKPYDTVFVMEQSLHAFAPIILTLQKLNTPDDVLIVVPENGRECYNAFFLQRSIGNGYTMRIPIAQFEHYIHNLFHVLERDENGCSHMQIDFPGYPTIIVSQAKFLEHYTLFRRQLQSIVADWPIEFLT
jgi:hypothetical protein